MRVIESLIVKLIGK